MYSKRLILESTLNVYKDGEPALIDKVISNGLITSYTSHYTSQIGYPLKIDEHILYLNEPLLLAVDCDEDVCIHDIYTKGTYMILKYDEDTIIANTTNTICYSTIYSMHTPGYLILLKSRVRYLFEKEYNVNCNIYFQTIENEIDIDLFVTIDLPSYKINQDRVGALLTSVINEFNMELFLNNKALIDSLADLNETTAMLSVAIIPSSETDLFYSQTFDRMDMYITIDSLYHKFIVGELNHLVNS